MPVQEHTTKTVSLANLAHLISRAVSLPRLMTGDELELLSNLQLEELEVAQSAVENFTRAWEQALEDPEALELSHARLFLGPFEILASPYASFYLDVNQQLMGSISSAVANAYAEAGLKPGEGPKEAPDHVALEWEFVYFLMHQYISTEDSEWLDKRDHFVESHMSQWLPKLCALIHEADVHPFYERWADLVEVVLPLYSKNS